MILPCYLRSIDIDTLLHLQAMKMIFLNVFLICKFKDPNLTENLKNLHEFFFKYNSVEFMEFDFS